MFSKLKSLFTAGNLRETLAVAGIILVSLIFYILTLKGMYGNLLASDIKNNLDQATKPFELSPERDRYILTQNLADNGSFALTQALADAAYPDVGYYQGRFYIFFAPGISLFALPFFIIGHFFSMEQLAAYFMITLFSVGNLILLYRISREIFKLPLWISLSVPMIFAFASTSWSYAVTLYQHQPTTFFILLGFYAVWKYKQDATRPGLSATSPVNQASSLRPLPKRGQSGSFLWGVVVWTTYALGILIDYPNVFLALPVMIYFFFSSWKIVQNNRVIKLSFRLAFITSAVLFVLINSWHAYYNYVNFGSPTRVSGSLTSYKTIKTRQLLQSKTGQAVIKQLGDNKQPIGFFKEESFATSSEILLFSVDRGIFLYSPIFVLGLLGILYSLRKINMETAVLLGIIGCNFFLYSSWDDPWGGYAFGPRYLIPSMAVLSLFTGIFLNKVKHNTIAKISAFVLFLYSSAIALLGVITTNAVPPKVEAIYFHTFYGYALNFQYLLSGKSSSFIYNQFFSNRMTLIGYYLVLYELLVVIGFVVMFIIPMFQEPDSR